MSTKRVMFRSQLIGVESLTTWVLGLGLTGCSLVASTSFHGASSQPSDQLLKEVGEP